MITFGDLDDMDEDCFPDEHCEGVETMDKTKSNDELIGTMNDCVAVIEFWADRLSVREPLAASQLGSARERLDELIMTCERRLKDATDLHGLASPKCVCCPDE